jgi:hypothetical protein
MGAWLWTGLTAGTCAPELRRVAVPGRGSEDVDLGKATVHLGLPLTWCPKPTVRDNLLEGGA